PPSSTPFPYTTLFRSRRPLSARGFFHVRHTREKSHASTLDADARAGPGRHWFRACAGAGCGGVTPRDGADAQAVRGHAGAIQEEDRKSTRLNSSHVKI